MNQRKNVLRRVTEGSELSAEGMPGVPLLELAGDRRVLIENHRGVTEYGSERIRVRVRYGELCVCGSGLALARMTRAQLVICGRIDSVEVCRRCKG